MHLDAEAAILDSVTDRRHNRGRSRDERPYHTSATLEQSRCCHQIIAISPAV